MRVYDKNPKLSLHTLNETINDSEYVFLSVPTPSNLDGSINLEIINENNFILEGLAKVNKIFWNDTSYSPKDCITITLKDLKILMPIKNIIDVNQEYERLKKILFQLKENLSKINQKLNNKDFIAKAPSDVIKENLDKKENIQREITSTNELMGYLSN